jgi:hypothetical protein
VTVGSLVGSSDKRCVSPSICPPNYVLNCSQYDSGKINESGLPPEQRRCCGCQPASCPCGTELQPQADGNYACVPKAGTQYFSTANSYDTACPAGAVPDYGNTNHWANHPGGVGCVACRYCGCGYEVQGDQCVWVAGSWCPGGKYFDTNSCSCQCSNTWYQIDVSNRQLGDMLTDSGNAVCTGKGKSRTCSYTNTGKHDIFSGSIPQCLYDTLWQIIQNSGFDPNNPYISDPLGNRYTISYWKINNGFPAAGGLVDDNFAAWILGRAQGIRHGIYGRGGSGEEDWAHVLNGTAFFDSSCNRIGKETYDSLPAECKGAGSVQYAEESVDSPVSLLWTADAMVVGTLYSKFPLNPDKPGLWHEWKASAKTPLLVFDPEHKGQIKSATQLFGNYTFGKKWKDGFDALASLDKNSDGKISATELEPLGLWFDNNIDGVAQAGEVKSAAEAGVTALYFREKDVSDLNGYVYVQHGYDRTSDKGKGTVSGKAVDWFARSYDHDPGAQTFDPATSPAGAWSWKTEASDDAAQNPPVAAAGLLTLADIAGKIEGHTYMELPTTRMRAGSRETGIAVKMSELSGTKLRHADGSTELHWEVIHHQTGSRTQTDAVIAADNSHMTGTSRLLKKDGTVAFSYNWKAERVVAPKQTAANMSAVRGGGKS